MKRKTRVKTRVKAIKTKVKTRVKVSRKTEVKRASWIQGALNVFLGMFQIPEFCPVCSGKTEVVGQFLYCKSKTCGSRLYSLVKVWIEKLGILNWGESLISSLTSGDNPQVKKLKDLYLLDVDDIARHCSGFKHAVKCYDTLHANKEVSLDLFMSALNIENLGIATANDIISSGRKTVEEIFSMTEEDFAGVQNVGKILARRLSIGLAERKQEAMDLLDVVSIVESEGSLFGRSFCITGATSKPRKSVEKDILNSGGLVKSSVSQGLSFLVTNETDTTSSKMMKAKKLSIPVISEQDLYEMME